MCTSRVCGVNSAISSSSLGRTSGTRLFRSSEHRADRMGRAFGDASGGRSPAQLSGQRFRRLLPPNVLCALQIVISSAYQGRGLSIRLIEQMAEIASTARIRMPHRAGAPESEAPLPARSHRTLCRMATGGRHAPRPMASHTRTVGGENREDRAEVNDDPGTIAESEDGGHGIPGERALRGSRRARSSCNRSGGESGPYVEPNIWMRHELGPSKQRRRQERDESLSLRGARLGESQKPELLALRRQSRHRSMDRKCALESLDRKPRAESA